MPSQMHPYFYRTVPGIPLTAELFQYAVAPDGSRKLELRQGIARDRAGSVYVGVCAAPTPFSEPALPFAAVVIWDVPGQKFRLRSLGAPEQAEDAVGGIFPAGPGVRVLPDPTIPPTTHLDFPTFAVRGTPQLIYCPSLEIAMLYREETPNATAREYVIQSIVPGDPALDAYELK